MIITNKFKSDLSINNIIFDIDGTITRWKNVEQFLKKSLDSLGVPFSSDALLGLYKAMKMREFHSVTTLESDEDVYSSLLEVYIEDLKKHGVSGNDLKDKMFELEAEETYVDDDVVSEIKQLSCEFNLYCYTNWFRNQAIKKLERYGLREYFKEIYSSEDNYVKFSKVGFLYLLDKNGLVAEETVHVGDSGCDIIPSSKSSIHTIYLDYGIKSTDDIAKEKLKLIDIADATVTEFSDIRKLLVKK